MTYPAVITLSKTQKHFERMEAQLDTDWPRLLVNNGGQVAATCAAVKQGWAVLEPGYNASFSAGNNMAAKAAEPFGHSHLLLLNDDLIPRIGFLDRLWEQRETADVLGAMLLHDDGTVNHAGGSVMFNGPRGGAIFDHIGRHQKAEQYAGTCPLVPTVTFAAVLIRRELWERLGGLDERYYYGWEDTDFCLRALQAGATIRCNRDAVATHNECGTRPRGSTVDLENAKVFAQTWVAQLSGIIADYATRCAPQVVEGI